MTQRRLCFQPSYGLPGVCGKGDTLCGTGGLRVKMNMQSSDRPGTLNCNRFDRIVDTISSSGKVLDRAWEIDVKRNIQAVVVLTLLAVGCGKIPFLKKSSDKSDTDQPTQTPDAQPNAQASPTPTTAPEVLSERSKDKFAVAYGHSLFLKADGTAYVWGNNSNGQFGDGSTANSDHTTAAAVQGGYKVVAAGYLYTLAVANNGNLYTWGYNYYGQAGDGSKQNSHLSPTKIGSDTTWQKVATSYQTSYGLKTDGTLWAWGLNSSGQVGDGTSTDKLVPTQILSQVKSLFVGNQSVFVIKNDGTLYGWGLNTGGQLGDNSKQNRYLPIKITNDTDWLTVATGNNHTLALKKDGSLWAWGQNNYGKLGDGGTAEKLVPTHIGSGTDWRDVGCGDSHSLAVKADGTLWAWGANDVGQLGDGSTTDAGAPKQIGTATDWQAVAGMGKFSRAIKSNGVLYTWGATTFGQLGRTSGNTSPGLVDGL